MFPITVRAEKLPLHCAEENGSVFVTKNGYGRLVVMDIDYFERTLQHIYESVETNRGIENLKDGKIDDGNAAMEAMRGKYGF